MSKKVFVISESAFRRNLIAEMISSHESILVSERARNEQETIDKIEKVNPDVLILDIELKDKEWLSPFNALINRFNIPTIILTDKNPKLTTHSTLPLISKSYDYIIKPEGVWREQLPKIRDQLIAKILMIDIPKSHKLDSKTRLINKSLFIQQSQQIRKKEDVNKAKTIKSEKEIRMAPSFNIFDEPRLEEYFLELAPVSFVKLTTKIIVIGASVGGPRTLRTILSEIPKNFPIPILVVQHLNHLFMRQFVVSLKNVCNINVKIGSNYEIIRAGNIYLSPGDKHMQVTVKNDEPCIRTFEGEPINYCRPSVDVLFYSCARVYKEKTLGILLTGMGRDGAAGLRAIKSNGGRTIAESEETSILYGMPKAAAEIGAADLIIPNYKIIDEIIRFVS